MKHIGKLLGYILLGSNIIFAVLFLVCAYSPYFNPVVHPVWSCFGLAFPAFLLINLCFLFFWLLFFWKYAFVSLLACLCCFSQIKTYFPVNYPVKEVPQNTFKLLSYNVMGFLGAKQHTKKNPNPIIEYLQNCDADVICLQEFIMGIDKYHLSKKDVDKALKSYPYKVITEVGNTENALACYSRYPILSSKHLEYESKYNGTAIYKLIIKGDTVTLINNHLESNKLTYEDKATYIDMIKDPKAEKVSSGMRLLISKLAEASSIRAKQVQIIADVIKECGKSQVIVCGDFNDTPISYAHRVLSQDLTDAFVQSGTGLGISYNQNKFYFRIDNILISKNLESFNCTVDNSIKDSDHYPIWCYIGKKDDSKNL